MITSHDKEVKRKLWQSPETLATTLLVMFLDDYAEHGGVKWSAPTISMEIDDDYDITMPSCNLDKLMAALQHLQSDNFYWSLPDFITTCNVFSGESLHPDLFDPADEFECAWGCTEAILLDPPDHGEELSSRFSEEIKSYVEKTAQDAGLLTFPDILQVVVGSGTQPSTQYDFSDDPTMFSGIWGEQKQKSDEVESFVRSRMRALLAQLGELKLNNGDTQEIAKQLLDKMDSQEKLHSNLT